jgi:outer membrane protein assembly factor BamA
VTMRARRKIGLCLTALVVMLARGSGRAQGEASDLLGLRIAAIEFECAAPIDVKGLTALMPMKVGAPLREDDLQEAQWRLKQTHLFTSISVEPQRRGTGVAVVMHVVRKSIVNRIRFKGNKKIGDSDLRRVVPLRESAVLTDKLRDYAVDRMSKKYVSEGFDEAHITAEVRPHAPGEVDVSFRIREGTPLRVGAVVIEGQSPIREQQIREAIKIRVGDRYVREQERAANKAVLRLFRDRRFYEAEVDSKWEPTADRTGTVRFRIDPGPLFTLEFSGNHRFSDRQLLDLIDLPKRPLVTDGTWRELARRAHRAYQEEGYYFATVDVSIEAGPPKLVRFSVDEGRIFHVAKVDFEGNQGLSAKQLRAVMATRPPSWIPWRRGVLLDNILDDDLKRLWYLYRRHGFEAGEIVDDRVRFDREGGQIFVTIIVDEGRQTIVRRIERTGLEPIAGRLPKLSVKVGGITKDRKFSLEAVRCLGCCSLAPAIVVDNDTHALVEPSEAVRIIRSYE